jgi:hypothetical protein
MVRFLVLYNTPADPDEQNAFASPEGKASAQDVPKFASGGVRSMAYELEELL